VRRAAIHPREDRVDNERMRRRAVEVALVAFGHAALGFILGYADGASDDLPFLRAAFRRRVSNLAEALNPVLDKLGEFIIGKQAGHAAPKLRNKAVVNRHGSPGGATIAERLILLQPVVVVP
jgi:hypothetical protein